MVHQFQIKFKYPNYGLNSSKHYNHIAHIYDLDKRGQLLVDNELKIFHQRYNGALGSVYNTGQ